MGGFLAFPAVAGLAMMLLAGCAAAQSTPTTPTTEAQLAPTVHRPRRAIDSG